MTQKQQLQEIYNTIISCKKCPRLASVTPFAMSHICYNDNLAEVKLFIIGRNPGIENDHSKFTKDNFFENYHKLWWVCKIGNYIRKEFSDNFVRKNMFFTNICKCSSPENKQLVEEEKENCVNYLKDQIKIINPKIIVTFGNEAKNTIKLLKDIKADIFHLVHPSYFYYNRDINIATIQFNKIKKVKEAYEKRNR